MSDPKKVLFVTWDGPATNYLQSLFLPIFSRLEEFGYKMHVLQFTWSDPEAAALACRGACVPYRSVRVMRAPKSVGPFITAVLGRRHVAQAVEDWNIDIVMPRSLMPALAVLLGRPQSPTIFDADGLAADERADFGQISRAGLIYKLLRWIECQAVRRASHVVVRTPSGARILAERAKLNSTRNFSVVSNGRDEHVFRPLSPARRNQVRAELGIDPTSFLLVYVGSLGPQYCPREMLYLLRNVYQYESNCALLVVTRDPRPLLEHLQEELAPLVRITTCDPEGTAACIGCADVGVALRERAFSMAAVSPIKLGEYLLCGIPVIATSGVGLSHAIEGNCGFLLENHDEESLVRAAKWAVSNARDRYEVMQQCRRAGIENFSLSSAVDSYRLALDRVGMGSSA